MVFHPPEFQTADISRHLVTKFLESVKFGHMPMSCAQSAMCQKRVFKLLTDCTQNNIDLSPVPLDHDFSDEAPLVSFEDVVRDEDSAVNIRRVRRRVAPRDSALPKRMPTPQKLRLDDVALLLMERLQHHPWPLPSLGNVKTMIREFEDVVLDCILQQRPYNVMGSDTSRMITLTPNNRFHNVDIGVNESFRRRIFPNEFFF